MDSISVVNPTPGGGPSAAATLTVGVGPTITVGAPTVAAGGVVTLTLTNGPGNVNDWVAFYCPSSAADGAYLDWRRMNDTQTSPATGLTSGTVHFTVPAGTAPGTLCEARWFAATPSSVKIATSPTVTVANPVPTLSSLTPAKVSAGAAAFTMTVTGTGF